MSLSNSPHQSDEQISPDDGRYELPPPSETSRDRYRAVADISAYLIQEQLGEHVPEDYVDAWRSVNELVYDLDNLVEDAIENDFDDELLGSLATVYGILLSELEAEEDDEEPLFALAQEVSDKLEDVGISAERVVEGFQHAFSFELEGTILNAQTAAELARARGDQGTAVATIMLDILPDEIKQHPGFSQLYRGLQSGTAALNILDSAADLATDHSDGQVRLPPTVKNRALLVKAAIPELLRTARDLDTTALSRFAGRAVTAIFRDNSK